MKEYRVRRTRPCAARAASLLIALAPLVAGASLGHAAEGNEGEALLESNCGRCHAVTAGAASPLKQAPNLYTVLGSYPGERLEFELAEGIGSRHRYMPQIQFSGEDISAIYYYLHGKAPESELRRPQ